jgi:hypothetical protein
MTLRKKDEIGILKRRHKIALSGEFALGDATGPVAEPNKQLMRLDCNQNRHKSKSVNEKRV